MKFFRNNLKVIIAFIVGVILASSITVYAYSYFASDIKYTNDKSVADALNDLYNKNKIANTVILSLNQKVSLTNQYTSTTSPNYYNEKILSYNSTNNEYTFLQDFTGKLYVAQGWWQGSSSTSMKVVINEEDMIVGNGFRADTPAYTFDLNFKSGDVIKIYSKIDANLSLNLPIAVDLIKN